MKYAIGWRANTQMCDFRGAKEFIQKKESPWQGILTACLVIAFLWLLSYTAQVYGIN